MFGTRVMSTPDQVHRQEYIHHHTTAADNQNNAATLSQS